MQQLLTGELLHFSKENYSAQLSSGLLLCGNGGTKFGLYTVLVLFKTVMYASVESQSCAELKSSLPSFSPKNQNVYLLWEDSPTITYKHFWLQFFFQNG